MADDAAESKPYEPFWYFDATSAGELTRRLVGAFTSGTFRRLEVRVDESQKHRPMTFRVVLAPVGINLDEGTEDINESHLCPGAPGCPPDE
jgi:hypothetical protein